MKFYVVENVNVTEFENELVQVCNMHTIIDVKYSTVLLNDGFNIKY